MTTMKRSTMNFEKSNYIRNIVVIVVALGLLTSLSACSGASGKKLNPALLGGVQYSMSERAVVNLLGKPDRIEIRRYKVGEKEMAKLLHYTLEDGRRWTIVINEAGELIGSGESGACRGKKISQKKSQVRK